VIRWWCALWDGEEHPRSLAIVRILVALVMLGDLLWTAHLGLVPALWSPVEAGGIPDAMARTPPPELYLWFPKTTATAWAAWGTAVGALVMLAAGLFSRAAGLLFLLVYAQLAWVLPGADRGIDMMVRNVVLILVLSGSHRAWSLDAKLFGARERIPAWPRRLLILQLVVMYFTAGIQKTALAWWPPGGYSALYVILQDPSIAAWKFGWLSSWWAYPATQVASLTTMVFEWSAGLLPYAYWCRATRTSPGRLRAFLNHLPFRTAWVAGGVLLHVGIAGTMALGIFPWAMLAMYPAFFHPDEVARLLAKRREQRPAALEVA
jgi:hypothetical protein